MQQSEVQKALNRLPGYLQQYITRLLINPKPVMEGLIANHAKKRWLIYGAGRHTQWLIEAFDVLVRLDVIGIIDDGNLQEVFGKNVYSLDEVEALSFDGVLISSKDYETQMAKKLKKRPMFSNKTIITLYDQNPFCDDISLDVVASSKAKDFVQKINRSTSTCKLLYFSSQGFFSIGRQVAYLQQHAKEISVFQVLPFSKTKGHLDADVESFCCEGDFYDLIYILSSAKITHIHCYFSMFTNYLFAFVYLFSKAKVIYETVDVSSFFFVKEGFLKEFDTLSIESEFEAEKLVFEQSDVLLLQSDKAREYLHEKYAISAQLYRFTPLINAGFVKHPIPKSLDEIRIVYAGVVTPLDADRQMWGDTQILNVARLLDEAQIYFDLYPNKAMGYNDRYKEYHDFAQKSQFVLVKDSIPPQNVTATLCQYHFGSMLYLFDGVEVKDEHLNSVIPTKVITLLRLYCGCSFLRDFSYVQKDFKHQPVP